MQPSQLQRAIRDYYQSLSESERGQLCLDSLLGNRFGISRDELPAPPLTDWFHATRAAPSTTFEDGILPRSEIVDRIWSFLGDLALCWSTADEWLAFRNRMRGEGANRYRLRADLGDEGPYGFLIRETILSLDRLGQWDYLAQGPETPYDICLSYREMFSQDLHGRFLDATRPCIVHFRSDCTYSWHVEVALEYLFAVIARDDRWPVAISNRSGQAVAPSAIVDVEWL